METQDGYGDGECSRFANKLMPAAFVFSRTLDVLRAKISGETRSYAKPGDIWSPLSCVCFFQRGDRNGNRVEDIAGENTARTAAFFGKSQGLTDDGMTLPPQHDTLPRDKHG